MLTNRSLRSEIAKDLLVTNRFDHGLIAAVTKSLNFIRLCMRVVTHWSCDVLLLSSPITLISFPLRACAARPAEATMWWNFHDSWFVLRPDNMRFFACHNKTWWFLYLTTTRERKVAILYLAP